ncbi:MAG: hypothetical protein ACXQTZ_03445 [Candidatus Alkanophagales archaeon]
MGLGYDGMLRRADGRRSRGRSGAGGAGGAEGAEGVVESVPEPAGLGLGWG